MYPAVQKINVICKPDKLTSWLECSFDNKISDHYNILTVHLPVKLDLNICVKDILGRTEAVIAFCV